MTDAEVRPGRGRRVRDFVASRSGAQQVGAVTALLVLLTWPFGGLESVEDSETATLRLGQRLDLGPFYVTIEGLAARPSLPPVIDEVEPGAQLLVVRIEVENHSDRAETASMVRDAFSGEGTRALPWLEGEVPALQVYDVDDAVEVPPGEYVNPGQSYSWALVLKQRDDVDLDQVSLAVTGYGFEEVDTRTTLDEDYWVPDDRPLAEGHLPIEDRT